MNIFIMILVALFMAGYYMLDSPSQRIANHETQQAITQSDLRTIAQCATALHNAQINGTEFQDVCIEQNTIVSKFICLDKRLKITDCVAEKNKKPAFNYLITATGVLDPEIHNSMMEILEQHYAESGTFGLFNENMIMSGGTATKRIVPKAIIEEMKLENGQLVYLTQYEIPDTGIQYEIATTPDIDCPAGTTKVYKFGRWQCIAYNTKTDCGGDMIWDSDLYECVPDESRKPLCADTQSAVIVDEVWECINPFPEKSCPDNLIARLNYNTLEWECVADPTIDKTVKKCGHLTGGAVYGGALGATLRVPHTSCTDCETMITDPETCVSWCVPDPAKIHDTRCYPGAMTECSGGTRAFYFGFPNAEYANKVEAVKDVEIIFDKSRAQNRKFNCVDCGPNGVDTEKSHPPYVVICK